MAMKEPRELPHVELADDRHVLGEAQTNSPHLP